MIFPGGTGRGTSGYARPAAGEALSTKDRLFVGSMTKLAMAALVLTRVERGLLSLDDSVVRLFDMAPLDDVVTVRMYDEAPHDLLLGGEVDPPGKAAMAAAAAAAMVLVRVISHPPFASRRRAGDERCGL